MMRSMRKANFLFRRPANTRSGASYANEREEMKQTLAKAKGGESTNTVEQSDDGGKRSVMMVAAAAAAFGGAIVFGSSGSRGDTRDTPKSYGASTTNEHHGIMQSTDLTDQKAPPSKSVQNIKADSTKYKAMSKEDVKHTPATDMNSPRASHGDVGFGQVQ